SRYATEFLINDDGLIVGRTTRSSCASDCCLTTNRYPLGHVNPGSPDECSSGKRNRVAVMRVCIMDRLHIRVRAVGWPNSSKTVRCYQKRQSSSDRKKFSHIQPLFFVGPLLIAYLLTNLLAEAPPHGREGRLHYDSSVRAVFYLVQSGLPKMG